MQSRKISQLNNDKIQIYEDQPTPRNVFHAIFIQTFVLFHMFVTQFIALKQLSAFLAFNVPIFLSGNVSNGLNQRRIFIRTWISLNLELSLL